MVKIRSHCPKKGEQLPDKNDLFRGEQNRNLSAFIKALGSENYKLKEKKN